MSSKASAFFASEIAIPSSMPGGTFVVTMSNGQQLAVSRIQGRILREHLLKL
jgi:hypothetical protein